MEVEKIAIIKKNRRKDRTYTYYKHGVPVSGVVHSATLVLQRDIVEEMVSTVDIGVIVRVFFQPIGHFLPDFIIIRLVQDLMKSTVAL